MDRVGHIDSILSLERGDLETIWLAMWGWLRLGLRPKELSASRLGILEKDIDPETEVALQIAADAAAVTLIRLPEAVHENSRDAVEKLAPALDAVAVFDPDGRFASIYEQNQVRVLNLQGPLGSPVEVVGRLYPAFIEHGFMKPLRVVWDGPANPALTSWVEATGEIPFTLVHVGDRHEIDPAFVTRLMDEGQAGRIERASVRPSQVDLDANVPISILTRAAAIAALFEWSLGRAVR